MSYGISLLFIIALIAAFVVLLPLLTGRLTSKINRYILCGYLALLVLLSAASFLVPRDSLARVSSPTISSSNADNASLLWHRLSVGNFSAPNGFVQLHKSFTPQSKTVSIEPSLFNGNIWVGRKGINVPDNHSGKIDVYFYAQTPLTFINYKYKPAVEPLSASLKGDTLSLAQNGQSLFDLSGVDDRLAARQFYNGFSTDIFNQVNANDYAFAVVLLPKGVTAGSAESFSYPTY